MGRKLVTAAALAALLAPSALGLDGGTATATLSNQTPGAASALSIGLRAELQCGRLVARTLTVRLPRQMRVPHTVAARAVSVGGRPAARVTASGSTVVVTIPPVRGAICDVLGPGVYRIAFSSEVGLRNPPGRGSYAFTVSAAPRAEGWRGSIVVG